MSNQDSFFYVKSKKPSIRYPVLPQSIAGQALRPQIVDVPEDLEKFDRSSTRYILDEAIKSDDWKKFQWNGFRLVGQDLPYATCGYWSVRGCLNKHKHDGKGNYFEPYKKSCNRPSCSVCIESWANGEANRATKRHATRIRLLGGKASHVIFSPPAELLKLDYKELQKQFRKLAKKFGVTGNCEVMHPARFSTKKMVPFASPHFHGIAYGWFDFDQSKIINSETGWVIKKIRTIKDEGEIFSITKYILTHAGIRQKIVKYKSGKTGVRTMHTVKWTGDISYRKLKVEKEPRKEHNCPECNDELQRLQLKEGIIGLDRPPPPSKLLGFSGYDGFELVKTFDKSKYYDDNWNVVKLEEDKKREALLEASITGKKTSYYCQRIEKFFRSID